MRPIWLLSGLLGLLAAIPAVPPSRAVPAPADQTLQASTAAPAAPASDTAAAQDAGAQAPAAAAPAAAAPPTWSVGPIDFSGTIDGYYGFNFNHPRPTALFGAGGNGGEANYLYNFDITRQPVQLEPS